MKKKNIIDYLKIQKDNKETFEDVRHNGKEFVHTDVTLELVEYGIHLYVNRELEKFINLDDDCEDEIMTCLYDEYGIEVRFCDYCGCPMQVGYTDDGGDFYNCEDCFPKDMDERYGKGNWREYDDEDGDCNELDGYYEYLEDGEWQPEPSYYTEWY